MRKIFTGVLLFLAMVSSALAGGTAASPFVTASIASLQALGSPGQYPYVQVVGYNAGSSKGGGLFIWNGSSTAATDSCTIFSVSGVTTGRYFRVLNGDLNVQMCGAVGNGIADDTVPIKADVAVAITDVRPIYFPCGSYLISTAIPVQSYVGGRVYGADRGCVTITQNTAATPIFKMTGLITWGFRFDDFTGNWTTQDSSTGAAIVETDNGVNGSSFNFEFDHINGQKGSRMLSQGTSTSMWGVNFHDNVRQSTMTGALIGMNAGPGEPTYAIRSNYAVMGNTQTEPMFLLYNVNELYMVNNEIDSGTDETPYNLATHPVVSINQSNGVIQGLHFEAFAFTGAGPILFVGGGGTNLYHVNLYDVAAGNINNTCGGCVEYLLYEYAAAQNSYSADIKGMTTQVSGAPNASAGVVLPYEIGGFARLASVQAINWLDSSGASLGHYDPNGALGGTYTGGYATVDYDSLLSNAATDNNDTSLTMTCASTAVQTWNEALTTNRTVTLPAASAACLGNQSTITILRNATSPGAFTLTMTNPAGASYVCAISTRCSVVFRLSYGGVWQIISASTY